MQRAYDTSVLIVGGGPVGLTLAMDLASRGIDVTVIETRRAGEPPNVKCNQVSARSMEIFRRLGVAGKIRETGLPPEFRNDVVCCVSATGPELSRITLPSRAGRVRGEKGDDGWWPTRGMAASDQSALSGAGPVRACGGAAAHPHSQPHAVRGMSQDGTA